MSPICHSPVSRGQRARHILTKGEKKTSDYCGPRKRLISPPQVSHAAKRPTYPNAVTQTAHGLSLTRSAQSHVHNKEAETFIGGDGVRQTSPRNGAVKNKAGSGFTLITERRPDGAKACETLNVPLRPNARAADAPLQKHDLTTAAVPRTIEGGGATCEMDAVRTAPEGDQRNGTNAESVAGIVTQLCLFLLCFMSKYHS